MPRPLVSSGAARRGLNGWGSSSVTAMRTPSAATATWTRTSSLLACRAALATSSLARRTARSTSTRQGARSTISRTNRRTAAALAGSLGKVREKDMGLSSPMTCRYPTACGGHAVSSVPFLLLRGLLAPPRYFLDRRPGGPGAGQDREIVLERPHPLLADLVGPSLPQTVEDLGTGLEHVQAPWGPGEDRGPAVLRVGDPLGVADLL